MKKMLRTVIKFFDSENWPYEVIQSKTLDRAKTVIRSTVKITQGNYTCLITVDEDLALLRFSAYLYLPTIEPSQFSKICEFIVRANSGISVGAFEFGFSDNPLVRFTTYIALTDIELTVPQLKRNILDALEHADEYFVGFIEVIADDATAIEVVAPIQQRLYGKNNRSTPDV
jgi:hypothetical protein